MPRGWSRIVDLEAGVQGGSAAADAEDGAQQAMRAQRRHRAFMDGSLCCTMLLLVSMMFVAPPNMLLYVCITFMVVGSVARTRRLRELSAGRVGHGSLRGTRLSMLPHGMALNPVALRLALADRDFDENDYDTLLALDNQPALQRFLHGADEQQIATLPSYAYAGKAAAADGDDELLGGAGAGGRTCAICLESFEEGETVRLLPCIHQFHAACIDRWLQQKAECPTCKHHPFQPPPPM